MVAADQGANYGPEFTALANSWKKRFGNENTHFYYTIPSKALAPKLTKPESIQGKNTAVEVSKWDDSAEIMKLIDQVASDATK